ncbi:general transcription factor 3C polypeptide 6 isoform X2 [Sorghum bicolor]|uniref:general transcription factor 3C polypeptide 6 isoform X2 n=1 Tax=Sorghum bicolor TaxID=4558 RepID=UPI000B42472D|nr:general transcription factor 3C polypeptide 6 isoform X2 [Sorghum bicolor]|eukprot:XP_021319002.1 general transcription factor 3C polypeptide 6 isoform X2 [Sorghum bicolor]
MSETLEKDKKLGQEEEEVEEEEYVLLELGDCLYSDLSPGAPFVLSGLDTLTPTLIVGNGLKMVSHVLIGEYEETVGTCYLFSESAQPKPASNETRPSEENTDKPTSCSKEALSKEVNHLASVQKILKFRPVNAERPQHLAYQHKDKEI